MHTDECESFWSVACPGRPRPCTGYPMSFGQTPEEALENWNLRTPIERVDIAEVRE